MSNHKKTICVDLDGVLAQYSGWKGETVVGAPMPGAREFLLALKEEGFVVAVFSTRAHSVVRGWMSRNDLPYDAITQKKIPAVAYVDDRAITFTGDLGKTLEQVKVFRAWWEGKNK